jgi:copper(I)-binding protein
MTLPAHLLARRLALAAVSSIFWSAATGPVLAQTYQAGGLVIETPWSRATPAAAKVGSAYMRIVNRGSAPDRLIGGTTTVAGRFEVHATSRTGDVVRMQRLDGGLAIGPGETVELKPGGVHVMLLDLQRPLKQGETIAGTLTFEKAGTVAVEFRVEGLGARSAGGNHQHH